jgi:hypothetical protein
LTFTRPELLWLGLVAIPIVVLHMVRRRRRRHRVPTLLLWDQILAKTPRRVALGIIAWLLSLLLILLAVTGGTLAAAGPKSGSAAPPPRHLLLVVDGSARMYGDRWLRARELVGQEIARKAPYDPVTLILVSDAPRILAAREPDGARVVAAIEAARPSLVRAAWPLAGPALSSTIADGGRALAIGVDPRVPPGTVVARVGKTNSGIVDFDLAVGAESVEIWVRTHGIRDDDEIVTVVAGEERRRVPAREEETFSIPRGDGGLLVVALDPGRGLLFDDSVSAIVPPRHPLRVLLAADEATDPFLAAALEVVGPLLDAEGSGRVAPDRVTEATERYDVYVLATRDPPARLPAGDWILLTPPPEALGFAALDPPEAAPIWSRAADHPVTKDVDAAEVLVMGATPARLPEGAVPLLSTVEGAVAAAGAAGDVRYVWIGLGPEDSTLPVTGAFPLLVRNALRWFASLREDPLPPAARLDVGLAPAIRLPPGTRAVAVEGPGKGERALLDVVDGTFLWRPPSQVEGEVIVRGRNEEARSYFNAILPEESTVEAPAADPPPGADRSGFRDTERRLWEYFAAAAAIALMLEWILGRLGRE